MEHENSGQAGKDTDGFRRGDDSDELPPLPGVGRSIQPGVSMPPTVLSTELANGTLIIQGRPDGPRVHLSPDDAIPLRRELAAAFARDDIRCAGDQEYRR